MPRPKLPKSPPRLPDGQSELALATSAKSAPSAISCFSAEISARAAEGEARIAEIRDSAMQAVEQVAEETAVAVVDAVMPGVADAGKVKAAVQHRLG